MLIFLVINTFMFSQENKNVEISKLVINSFKNNEFQRVVKAFDPEVKALVKTDELKLAREDLNIKYGKFQKFTTITVSKILDYDVTFTLCAFENMNLEMKLVFSNKNKVISLLFAPEIHN
jgi:hypothetical protein